MGMGLIKEAPREISQLLTRKLLDVFLPSLIYCMTQDFDKRIIDEWAGG